MAQTTFDEAVAQVEKNTVGHLYPLWMNNFAENLPKARRGLSLDKIYAEEPVKRTIVVGRGPSLFRLNHLDFIAQHKFPVAIVASDGSLPLLLEHGIKPHAVITVDGSPVIAKWYANENLKGKGVRAVLPITVHPDTVTACEDNNVTIYWYIPELDVEKVKVGITDTLQLQTVSGENPTGISRLNGAGCAGNCAIVFSAIILRTAEICLVGMDCGYRQDTPIEELHYHKSILESCGYKPEDAAKLYKILFIPEWNDYAVIDPVFAIYQSTFIGLSKQLNAMGVRLVNATGGGVLVAKDVQCMSLQDYYKTLER